MAKKAFWFLCLMLTFGYSGWIAFNSKEPVVLDDKSLSHSMDTLITNVSIHEYDEQGKLINVLYTPEIAHIPSDDVHVIKKPYLVLAQANQSPWEISAEKAKAIHGGREVTFLNHVIVHQKKGDYTEESTMKTDELTYFPKQQLAMSHKAVRFEQPGKTIVSMGMKAYLAAKSIQLLSQTHVRVEPTHG